MFIICTGADTFRALAKAQELERAFIEKHDPSGISVERLQEGNGAADAIIERVNTVSLFTPKRFIRVADVLDSCPKAKQKSLVQALGRDPEHVIVVSIEHEVPSAALLNLCSDIPKFIRYDFPLQTGREFLGWAQQHAETLGIQDKESTAQIARNADGDAWMVANELVKVAAGGMSTLTPSEISQGIFEYADAYLRGEKDQYAFLRDEEITRQALTMFLSQTRSALRVRDGATSGLHPYVVKKMQRRYSDLEMKHLHTLLSLFLQRASYGTDVESAVLL